MSKMGEDLRGANLDYDEFQKLGPANKKRFKQILDQNVKLDAQKANEVLN